MVMMLVFQNRREAPGERSPSTLSILKLQPKRFWGQEPLARTADVRGPDFPPRSERLRYRHHRHGACGAV